MFTYLVKSFNIADELVIKRARFVSNKLGITVLIGIAPKIFDGSERDHQGTGTD